ncbi:hypothetical protein ACHAQH_001234 [Verticillium albo-atrum]
MPREYRRTQSQPDDKRDRGSRDDNLVYSSETEATGFARTDHPDDLLSDQPPPLPQRRANGRRIQHSDRVDGLPPADSFVIEDDADPNTHLAPRARSPERLANGPDVSLGQVNDVKILIETQGALNAQIRSLKARAEIAEEKQELAERALADRIRAQHSLNDVLKKAETLTTNLEEAKKENEALKEQLHDAQSHIFSLQPYRKDVTPEEVGRQYTNLVDGVGDWVAKFMSPWLDHHQDSLDMISNGLRKRPADAVRIKRMMLKNADLVHATKFPDSDEDVIVSLVLRHLNDSIYQKTLYGAIPESTGLLQMIETTMQSVEPKRDLFATRTWIAEAYTALISVDDFRFVRQEKEKEIAQDLVDLLGIFCTRGQLEAFYEGFVHECVRPAMQLYEKILLSTHLFYLDHTPYIVGPRNNLGGVELSPAFLEHLSEDKLDCKNIVQSRKTFNPRKLSPEPTRKELYHNIEIVCMVAPALYMRQIGGQDAIREPDLVRKQQMLVVWGSEEKRNKYKKGGERTLMNVICSSNEREGWSGLRWP